MPDSAAGITRYFDNLPQRFNLDPVGVPVLTLADHPAGLPMRCIGGWVRVRDFTLTLMPGYGPLPVADFSDTVTTSVMRVTPTQLTVTPGAGSTAGAVSLDLTRMTVAGVIAAITASGYAVTTRNAGATLWPATTLAPKRVTVAPTGATFLTTIVANVPSVAEPLELDLNDPLLTMTMLRDRLLAAGYVVSLVDDRFAAVSPTALAEVDRPLTGQVTLGVATSVLWRIFLPVALEGQVERTRTAEAVRQIDLRIADGLWLERIAQLYGLRREEGEDDEALRYRIDYHAIRPHSANEGLVLALLNLLDLSETDNVFDRTCRVEDQFTPTWMTTDDPSCLTGQQNNPMDNCYTMEGAIPCFTVILDDDLESEDPPVYPYQTSTPSYPYSNTNIPTQPRATADLAYPYDVRLGAIPATTDDESTYTGDGIDTASATQTYPGDLWTLFTPDDPQIEDAQIRTAVGQAWRIIRRYKAAGTRFQLLTP